MPSHLTKKLHYIVTYLSLKCSVFFRSQVGHFTIQYSFFTLVIFPGNSKMLSAGEPQLTLLTVSMQIFTRLCAKLEKNTPLMAGIMEPQRLAIGESLV